MNDNATKAIIASRALYGQVGCVCLHKISESSEDVFRRFQKLKESVIAYDINC